MNVSVAGWAPIVAGANVTLARQLEPTARFVPQFDVTAYGAFAVMLVIASATLPEFDN
jgi:hypothetical protein